MSYCETILRTKWLGDIEIITTDNVKYYVPMKVLAMESVFFRNLCNESIGNKEVIETHKTKFESKYISTVLTMLLCDIIVLSNDYESYKNWLEIAKEYEIQSVIVRLDAQIKSNVLLKYTQNDPNKMLPKFLELCLKYDLRFSISYFSFLIFQKICVNDNDIEKRLSEYSIEKFPCDYIVKLISNVIMRINICIYWIKNNLLTVTEKEISSLIQVLLESSMNNKQLDQLCNVIPSKFNSITQSLRKRARVFTVASNRETKRIKTNDDGKNTVNKK